MTYNHLPNIDQTVLAALDFFSKNSPAKFKPESFQFPIVVGSGNAYNTAQVVFSNQAAIIANESNFKKTLASYQKLIKQKTIKDAIIISASGEKDSVWETALAKKHGLKTTLLTWTANSSAGQLADKVIVYKKLPEPYTYNVSTYLSLLLSTEKTSVAAIQKTIAALKLPNFQKYQAFAFILPDDFAAIAPMLEIKRDELFGPHVSLRAFSFGQARHAKFVNNFDKELVISLGKNKYFGLAKNRWEIKLPKQVSASLIMSLTYYLVGKIQAGQKPYYKNNIAEFCLQGPKAYGQKKPFSIIVE